MLASLRQAVRRLLRAPLFTVTTVVTLALGIGANVAIYSVLDAVLLEPLPYEDPDELVGVWFTAPGIGIPQLNQSAATYLTLRDRDSPGGATAFEDIALWDNDQAPVTGRGEPEQVDALYVTDGFFPLLRVSATLGRVFTPEDDSPGGERTVVLGHAYWQERFGASPDVVGQSLDIWGRPTQVIGVLPEGFRFLDRDAGLYLPFRFDPAEVIMGQFNYQGVARLAPGATLARANAEVERSVPVAIERFPGGLTLSMLEEARLGADVHPLAEDVVGDVGEVLWVLLGAVGLLLLIACANVANLFLVRAEGRYREVALRSALGAGRARLARSFLAESLSLGLVAGLFGLLLAAGLLQLLVTIGPRRLPRLHEVGIDGSVLVFALAISLLAGLLFGAVPLLRLRTARLAEALKEGGRGGSSGRERHLLRNGLVVAQVAIALVLLVGSGLMLRSFQSLRQVWPGFDDPREVVTFRLSVPSAEVEEPLEVAVLHERIREQLRALPGVTSVGASSSVAMDRFDSNDALWVEGFPIEEGQLPPIRRYKMVTEDYFATLENPLLAGRPITAEDLRERREVVVVTENLAREYWSSPAEAIGKRVSSMTGADDGGFVQGPWREIVGVVRDVHDDGVDRDAPTIVYFPAVMDDFWDDEIFAQRSLGYVVRTSRQPATSLLPEIREAVWSLSPSLPLANPGTLQENLERSLARTTFTMVMLGLAAAIALVLGAVGIYGVLSYLVSQRTREIGVRMALGARRGDVRSMLLRQGLGLTAGGIVLGVVGAVFASRLLSALLFGVEAIDPLTYVGVSLFLAAVALFASGLAARRATRVDPLVALRAE